MSAEDGIEIAPYAAVAGRPELDAEFDAIFFEASSTRSFSSEKARTEFRWRWLGRYLEQGPEHAFVALDPTRRLAGYLIGSLSDPARPLDPELPFYAHFADQTRAYPAHLHINLAPGFRSRGTGGRLIEAFAAHAGLNGAPGMHIVTSRGQRNIGFYQRCGFTELAALDWNDRALLMLGRRLV